MPRTRQLHPVPLTERLRRRLAARQTGEQGLALLDVLLGMAIFALIAVIAVQSMGMFRDRAYMTQATSDAKQVGAGIMAAMTEPGATPEGIPTGLLSAEDLERLGVNLTGGNRAYVAPALFSAVGDDNPELISLVSSGATAAATLISTSSNINGFDVCVENDSAYATWRAAGGSVAETGYIPGDGDCLSVLGIAAPSDEDDATPTPVGSYEVCDTAPGSPAPLHTAQYYEGDEVQFPGLADLGLSLDDEFYPSQTGIAEADWESERDWYESPFFSPSDVEHLFPQHGMFFLDAEHTIVMMSLDESDACLVPTGGPDGPDAPDDEEPGNETPVEKTALEIKCESWNGNLEESSTENHSYGSEDATMPWDEYSSQADFEEAIALASMREHASIDWWPATESDKANFSMVADAYGWHELQRDGDAMLVEYTGLWCNATS